MCEDKKHHFSICPKRISKDNATAQQKRDGPVGIPPTIKRGKQDSARISALDAEEVEEWDRCWSLESSGIEEYAGTKCEEKAQVNAEIMQYFNNTIEKRHDGYYVRLPFKKNCDTLPTNKTLAYRRLISVWNMLKSNEDLPHQYHKVFQEQLEKGIIEEVPNTGENPSRLVHYLPHQPVVTPQ
ncbi:hypothetical protein NECAME_14172 [Necator americanus]|uniref:Uncharacterized protein n=1 Tax=Necator americanus TaxID=51031 RepID=W2SPD0_NECAM|nr:hypothetical protein NECAME_14172 [Necator americanus]ETN71549.1 hypothetical protein NECAME_14172 [Necator americanus]